MWWLLDDCRTSRGHVLLVPYLVCKKKSTHRALSLCCAAMSSMQGTLKDILPESHGVSIEVNVSMLDTNVVFYNRVPKCGSELVRKVITELAEKKGNFSFHKATQYLNYQVDYVQQVKQTSVNGQ